MGKILRLFLLAAFLVLIGILVFNTPKQSQPANGNSIEPIPAAGDSAAWHLSRALQIKTVSKGDTLPIDTAEFVAFRQFLESSYPLIHRQLQRQIFNEFSYLYRWKGKDSSLAPWVLMAHTDVVPVEAAVEKNWSVPSFSGAIKNDTIWGRGAVDDKSSVIAIMEAIENLLQLGFIPERTIYIALGHDEEVAGRRGARVISDWMREQKIRPAFVLDEGGQIDTEHFKELGRPVAIIATGEKGYTNIDLSVELPGGHSSMPAKETAIDILNKAVVAVREKQIPGSITPVVEEMIRRTTAPGPFLKRMVTHNLWLTEPLVKMEMEKSKETNALIHTTLVPTIVQGGIKDNVIPSTAKATFNSRILQGQSSDDVLTFVKKAVNDERVLIKKQTKSLMEPSSITPFRDPSFLQLERIIKNAVPNVIVSPFLMIGASDSRYFRDFSEAVLNFSAIQNMKGFHGIDERIGIKDLDRMIWFYKQLLQQP
ncbi:MAG: M20/M25/M40 family metallo-hydrolase [Bacteroidota bacterium]|jgi:carboxypeptidase PM20D1